MRRACLGPCDVQAAVTAVVLLVAAAPASAALEETRCRLEAPRMPAVLAHCADLVVPEDPARPEGPKLSLFVARVPALTAAPRRDPLALIAGGPGQSSVDFYLQMRRAFEPARRERDLLLLDQRGTGRSADGFRCELTEAEAFDTGAPEALRAATEVCLIEIARDPRLFSTAPAVADLEALRAALGVSRWNLYGISYGTRVAQEYARRFPQHLRALILDGVLPADLVLGPGIAHDAERALDAIFERCRADPRCAARHPDLRRQFDGLRLRLSSGPVSVDLADPQTGKVEARLFSEGDFAGVVRLMSYSAATASLLPLAISEAYRGDYTLLAAQADILTGELAAAISMPMHNSVVCTEDVPFYPDDAGASAGTYLGSSVVDALETICEVWPAGRIDPELKTPVEFAGPALLLSGENDPVTPPRYALHAMSGGLGQAVHVIGRGQGHGMAGIGCAPRLIAAFLETASPAALDASCLEAEQPAPFFLSPEGPAP